MQRHEPVKARSKPIFRSNLILRLQAAGLVAILSGLPVGGHAQNTGMQELLNRVERLQREITTLQRQVYKGEAPPPSAASPVPPAGQSAGDPRGAGRNTIRINQLENELRRLTGRIEQIDFRTRQIQSRLEKLVSDMDQRLTALEGGTVVSPPGATVGQLPAGPGSNVGIALRPPPPPPGAASAPVLRSPPPADVRQGSQPGVLGTIPKNLAVSKPQGPATVAPPPGSTAAPASAAPAVTASAPPVLPAGTPKAQYDYALSLMLKQQDFAKAETALKAFIGQHPQDKLTGNAHYWLGETYYVRKSYQDAAFAFAEGFQKFPKNNKAPDSLLKLGMSLERLKKRKEACTAYSRLLGTFPKVAPRMKARVQREQRRAKCR